MFFFFFLYFSAPYRPLPWQTAARTAKIMSRESKPFFADAEKNMYATTARQALIKPNYFWRQSAVLSVGLFKAQGLWGQWSHLGQGIVPLETCHAETSQYLVQLAAVSHSFSAEQSVIKTMLLACDGSEILLPGLDHSSVSSVPSVVQSSGLFVISLRRQAIQSCTR